VTNLALSERQPVTVVLWASAFVAIRSAGGHFAPGALALGRLLVASLALGMPSAFCRALYLSAKAHRSPCAVTT
jgi:hypothetical protein